MSVLTHVSLTILDEITYTEAHDTHLRACLDDAADRALIEHADVLYFTRAVSADEVAAQLAAFPGCMVSAGSTADGSVLLAVRGGGREGICPLIASAVHALLASGMCGSEGVGRATQDH
jgi:hypothetical protein